MNKKQQIRFNQLKRTIKWLAIPSMSSWDLPTTIKDWQAFKVKHPFWGDCKYNSHSQLRIKYLRKIPTSQVIPF